MEIDEAAIYERVKRAAVGEEGKRESVIDTAFLHQERVNRSMKKQTKNSLYHDFKLFSLIFVEY